MTGWAGVADLAAHILGPCACSSWQLVPLRFRQWTSDPQGGLDWTAEAGMLLGTLGEGVARGTRAVGGGWGGRWQGGGCGALEGGFLWWFVLASRPPGRVGVCIGRGGVFVWGRVGPVSRTLVFRCSLGGMVRGAGCMVG